MVFDYLQLVADRANLRKLRHTHPDWSIGQLARELDHCRNWVKKWLHRFAAASDPDDQAVLHNLPPITRKPRPQPPALLLDRLEELRQTPPDNLKRTPGPRTLAYFLAKDEALKKAGLTPPRSTATIHRLLCLLGLLAHPWLEATGLLSGPVPSSASLRILRTRAASAWSQTARSNTLSRFST